MNITELRIKMTQLKENLSGVKISVTLHQSLNKTYAHSNFPFFPIFSPIFSSFS